MGKGRDFQIVGQGLAGTCLGWQLKWRGVSFRLHDRPWEGAASKVAAGLLNPVTGKNFEPSWRIAEFLPEAVLFFNRVEQSLGRQLWHPMRVVRLVTEKDWKKVSRKLDRPEVAEWVEAVEEHVGEWRAAVSLRGGGRFDSRTFCELSRNAFGDAVVEGEFTSEGDSVVRCEGAQGLIEGSLGRHRCAKGEILTVKVPRADPAQILIGSGGWLVPVGDGLFKAGATYEWESLDGAPTSEGRAKVLGILARLGFEEVEVVRHEAGVRPIIRRSMPLIGRLPDGSVVFNGLGSKGSLYAPDVSRRLVESLLGESKIEEELDVGVFLDGSS